ncbi:prenyltransferase [Myxococcota bacterium]|nr:prenyltransferase [Myxococcota bacterium]
MALGAAVVVLVHVLTHFVNDAEDVETDERTERPTALTGGSRAIQRGLVIPGELRRASAGIAAVVLTIGAYEAAAGDPAGAALHLGILGLGYSYSGRPLALGRRGLGEVTAAAVMGVLVPLAGAHAAGGIPAPLWGAAALLFALTVFARLCTSWPDVEADRQTGKLTLLVVLGPRWHGAAFACAGAAVAGVGLAAAPSLPASGWQAAAALGAATVAAGIAWAVRTGRAERRPVWVPLAGLGAYGASLGVLLVAYLGG